jgi:tetratricopeptide (TPR) repeat protein
VLRANDRVRLTAQLIDAKTDTNTWSHSYERNSNDVINLQKQLASDVSNEVGARLGASELALLSPGGTVSPGVFDALLQGRFHQQRGSRAEINRAIEFYQQATLMDPDFAPAYASLSSAYTDLRSVYVAPREVMPKAKAAAMKALELNETLPEGHAALGNVMMFYDYDWQGAERELKRAIELRPSYAEAHAVYGRLLSATKRFDEAKAQILEARKLDPISPFLAAVAAATFYNLRDYDNAVAQGREAVKLDPDLWLANAFLGLALQKKGDLDGAIKVLEHARTVNDSPTILEMLGGVYAEAGRTGDARKIVDVMIQRNSRNYVCPYEIATTLVALQEKEAALQWLKKSIEARADCTPWIGVDSKLDPLRSDPRFREMVESVGLDPDVTKKK